MTVGEFLSYILFTGLVAAPIVQIASIGTQISEALAGLDRIRDVFAMATEDQEDDARRRFRHRRRGRVRARQLRVRRASRCCATYRSARRPARRPRWSDRAGRARARSSASSWRSTVRVRGRARRRDRSGTVRLRDYRSQLGVVLQDNFLFDGTIAANIAYGRPDASDEEVYEVSRIAHCRRVHREVPGQIRDDRGRARRQAVRGQRQRVAIARAILADPEDPRSSTKRRRASTARARR